MKFLRALICVIFINFAFADGVLQYYANINKAAKNKEWWKVISYSRMLLNQFPQEALSSDATFFLAEAYFNVNELENANDAFSKYLSREFSPKFYEEALRYKFQIAKKYYEGAKKHLLGSTKMPKLLSGREDALKIFDEVLNGMPNSDMAIESLFYKGKIHALFQEYKDSIDAFNTLIMKYPKHELAIESFLQIGKVYLMQADPKRQDPNLIDLIKINLKKFKEAFPKEDRIKEAEEDIKRLQDTFAKGLYEIGNFYERTKHKEASILYYKKIISGFPDSNCAKLSQKRLDILEKK